MIKQRLLPFKIGLSREVITPRSGLAIYSEFLRSSGIKELVEDLMPSPGSNRGYRAWQYIEPILLMLIGGGRHIEELREIIEDEGLRRLTGMKKVPSTSTVGDWLRRQGNGLGLLRIKGVIKGFVKRALRVDSHNEYTLYSDPTIIEAEKQGALMTYRGVRGYRPIITVFKEFPVIVDHEFRGGNAVGKVFETIKRAYEVLPEGKRIVHASLDSEYYRADVMEYLRSKGTRFTIAVDKDVAVKELIKGIKEWRPFRDSAGVLTNKEIGEAVHTMNKLSFSFRLIVLRWRPEQGDLFNDGYCYHCIATDLEGSAEEVVWNYNERVHIENVIKEIKNGFGMESMPTGDFGANSFWFSLGVLAYNSFIVKKHLVLPDGFRRKTIQSMRWLFYEVAGKVVEHARGMCLKIYADIEKFILYQKTRLRCAELSV